jgi:hypothetical protein
LLLLLRQAYPLPGTSALFRAQMSAGRSVFANTFSRTYRRRSPHSLNNGEAWTVVHAAARLAEGIVVEESGLTGLLEKADAAGLGDSGAHR